MAPNENNLHKIPEMQFKRKIISIFKQPKENTNIFLKSTSSKSNQDMKITFNKGNDMLKKSKTEMMVGMKNADGQRKSAKESHTQKVNHADDRISRQHLVKVNDKL